MNEKIKIAFWIILICSSIGFFDAGYLAIKHYDSDPVICGIFKNQCNVVTKSEYSEIFGVPVALLGVFYYVFIIILAKIYLFLKKQFVKKIILPISFFGFAFSAWFVYLQIFVLKSICSYCMISALASLAIFVCGIFIFFVSKKSVREIL